LKTLHRFRAERQPSPAALTNGPLTPSFILQAENGNLAGYLSMLEYFYAEIEERPLFDERVLKGVADTISLMSDSLKRTSITAPEKGEVILTQLVEEFKMCSWFLYRKSQSEVPLTHTEWHRILNTLAQRAAIVEVTLRSLARKYPAANVAELGVWTNSLTDQVRGLTSDLHQYAPWTSGGFTPLASLIRKYGSSASSALTRWNRIIEMLDHVPPISRVPETLRVVLSELRQLNDQLDHLLPTNTTDRAAILEGCARLKSSVDTALRASNDRHSRYVDLASRSAAIMDLTDLGSLFDEERRVMRNWFPEKMG